MYNVLLKKVKIALSLTSEEMLEVFDDGGIRVSKAELGALLRKKAIKLQTVQREFCSKIPKRLNRTI